MTFAIILCTVSTCIIHIYSNLKLHIFCIVPKWLPTLHSPSDAVSYIRSCVYSTYPTSRRSGNLCITISEPLLAMLTYFKLFCLSFAYTSSVLQAYQWVIPTTIVEGSLISTVNVKVKYVPALLFCLGLLNFLGQYLVTLSLFVITLHFFTSQPAASFKLCFALPASIFTLCHHSATLLLSPIYSSCHRTDNILEGTHSKSSCEPIFSRLEQTLQSFAAASWLKARWQAAGSSKLGALKGRFQCLHGLHVNITSNEDHKAACQWINIHRGSKAWIVIVTKFFRTTAEFSDTIIGPNGVQPDLSKLTAIVNWKTPENSLIWFKSISPYKIWFLWSLPIIHL